MAFTLSSLHNTLWLVEPSHLRRYVERIAKIPTCPTARDLVEARRRRLDAVRQAATELAAQPVRSARGKVGVIPVYGPVEQRVTPELEKLGGTSLEEVGMYFDMLMAEPSVSTIVLDVDSPGGSSYGVQELSDKIFAARGTKKIYAIANSLAASASYWVATAAEQLFVTPGGDVGSVGVYCVHVDESKALEEDGVKISVASAGKYKTELAPWAELSEDGRAHMQDLVDRDYGRFLNALRRNRGVSLDDVRKNFGQGRVVPAEAAVSARMADRVMSMDELGAKLFGDAPAAGGRKASAEILRLRHQHAKAIGG